MTPPTAIGATTRQATAFFARLSEPEQRALQGLGTQRSYPRGTSVFHERQEADSVIVVLEGHVKVSRATASGREALLAFRGPGELLGELAAIDGKARSASAIAVEDAAVLVVPASQFIGFLHENPRVTFLLLETLSARLREGVSRLLELSAYDTTGRLAARLLELAEAHGEPSAAGIRITLPITQEELAASVGASREATTKALHSLRELGWVKTARREITVLDLDALGRRAALAA